MASRLLKGPLSADTKYGIFPYEASITRPIGAVLFERNDEWLHVHLGMPNQRNSLLDRLGSDEAVAI